MVTTVKGIMDTITIGIICMMRGDVGILSIDKVRNTIENMMNPAVRAIDIVNSKIISSYIIGIEEFRLSCIDVLMYIS